jgi:hypothetical protein
MEVDDEGEDGGSQDQLVKKLVRYALACEYSRQPIRREGIRDKGICPQLTDNACFLRLPEEF